MYMCSLSSKWDQKDAGITYPIPGINMQYLGQAGTLDVDLGGLGEALGVRRCSLQHAPERKPGGEGTQLVAQTLPVAQPSCLLLHDDRHWQQAAGRVP